MAGESARESARRMREKSQRLSRMADNWEKGADGEAATAAVLRDLPPAWFQIHDVRWPGARFANIDHVVVGPGGVFVIDSKNWSGSISVNNGILRQNGYRRETAIATCAEASLAITRLVPSFAHHVRPVMCFYRTQPLREQSRGVLVCSTSTLLELLHSFPIVLQPAHVNEIRFRVELGLTTPRRLARPTRHPSRTSYPPQPAPPQPAPPQAAGVPTPRPHRRPTGALPSPRRPRLARFLVGFGIWTGLMILLGIIAALAPVAETAIVIVGYAAIPVAWLAARRIIPPVPPPSNRW